nr:copper chaperone PCu(A)C [Actinopolymorpha pittospori]
MSTTACRRLAFSRLSTSLGVGAALLATAALLAGCGGHAPSTESGGAAAVVQRSGSSLTPENGFVALPDDGEQPPSQSFTTVDGRAWTFDSVPNGHLTLLYYGYTRCPDVCPTTMADLAATMGSLSRAERARISVVMISTDPKRDTDSQLKSWLGQFDPSFVGISAPIQEVVTSAHRYGVGVEPPKVTKGDYEVSHGAQVVALRPGGHQIGYFQAGTSVQNYVEELPRLLARYGAAAGASSAPNSSATHGQGNDEVNYATGTVGKITVQSAYAATPVRSGSTAMTAAYISIVNNASHAIDLVSASSPAATRVELHTTVSTGAGAASMKPVDKISIPPHGMRTLRPGGDHLMVTGLRQPVPAGGRLPLTLRFAGQAGKVASTLRLDLPVVARAQAGEETR